MQKIFALNILMLFIKKLRGSHGKKLQLPLFLLQESLSYLNDDDDSIKETNIIVIL